MEKYGHDWKKENDEHAGNDDNYETDEHGAKTWRLLRLMKKTMMTIMNLMKNDDYERK